MIRQQTQKLLLLNTLMMLPIVADAAQAGSESNTVWNLVIALFVLIFTVASAVLPIAALRQWTGSWRYAAAFPLLLLLLWAGIIASAKILAPESHRLWPFEIFAWAMLNMIYMVAAMTIKRIFEKADQQTSTSD